MLHAATTNRPSPATPVLASPLPSSSQPGSLAGDPAGPEAFAQYWDRATRTMLAAIASPLDAREVGMIADGSLAPGRAEGASGDASRAGGSADSAPAPASEEALSPAVARGADAIAQASLRDAARVDIADRNAHELRSADAAPAASAASHDAANAAAPARRPRVTDASTHAERTPAPPAQAGAVATQGSPASSMAGGGSTSPTVQAVGSGAGASRSTESHGGPSTAATGASSRNERAVVGPGGGMGSVPGVSVSRSSSAAGPLVGAGIAPTGKHALRTLTAGPANALSPTVLRAADDAFAARVGRALAAALQQGEGVVTLRLSPDGLGPMRVTLESGDRGILARLEASTDPARALLANAIVDLRAALEARSVSVDRIELAPPRDPTHHDAGASSEHDAPSKRHLDDGTPRDPSDHPGQRPDANMREPRSDDPASGEFGSGEDLAGGIAPALSMPTRAVAGIDGSTIIRLGVDAII